MKKNNINKNVGRKLWEGWKPEISNVRLKRWRELLYSTILFAYNKNQIKAGSNVRYS